MMRGFFVICLGLFLAVSLPVQAGPSQQLTDQVRLVWVGDAIDHNLKLSNILTRKRGKLMQVAFQFKNAAAKRISFEYLLGWEDVDGFPVGAEGVWEPVLLDAGAERKISVLGKAKGAEKVVIQIRPR